MELFETGTFHYQNGKLFCEHVAIEDIIRTTGTPAYIYSKGFFTERFMEFEEAFKDIKHSIFFAAKSNFNLNVMKVFTNLGAGLDVNSAGELYRARNIGTDPRKIIMSGVGKTREEIKLALEHNIKLIKVESIEELQIINNVAKQLDTVAPVAFRVNPNVDAKTHPYISTGLAENKFGIDSSDAERVYNEASELENVALTGIDMHIGSQITTIAPFVEAIEKMAELYVRIKSNGIPLSHFDIGGGIGVRYKDERVFTPSELAQAIKPVLSQLNCEVMFEPGRYLTANGGILVAEVLYTKKNRNKTFYVTDGAMTELIRPSLYSAYHHVQPITINKDREDIKVDIVGPVCESSDFIAKNRDIQKCEAGEFLAVMTTGAYGMVMASNYNGRRRPPEILVDGNKFNVVRSRETYEHLLWDETIVKPSEI